MNLLISKLFGAVVQVIIFALIPFIFWLVSSRKEVSFFKYIGLKGFGLSNKKTVASLLLTSVLFSVLAVFVLKSLDVSTLATSELVNTGMLLVPSVLIYAFIQTALSEEILFRGFILKIIAKKYGFMKANLIQSILFGLLHSFLLLGSMSTFKVMLIALFTGSLGWLMGYINEKLADGSIIPSWIIHGVSNVVASVVTIQMIH